MTKEVKERIKKITEIDKKLEKNFNLNDTRTDKNEIIIDVNIDNYIDGYSKFSIREDLRINPSLLDYLEREHTKGYTPVIHVYNREFMKNKQEQQLFALTLKAALTHKRIIKYSDVKHNTIWTIIYAIIALSLIVAAQFIPTDTFYLKALLDFVVILQWVCGWACIDFILARRKLKEDYIHMAKLSYAKISFFTCYKEAMNSQNEKTLK